MELYQINVGAKADASAPVRGPRCIRVEYHVVSIPTYYRSWITPEVIRAGSHTPAVCQRQSVDLRCGIVGIDPYHDKFICIKRPIRGRRVCIAARVVETLRATRELLCGIYRPRARRPVPVTHVPVQISSRIRKQAQVVGRGPARCLILSERRTSIDVATCVGATRTLCNVNGVIG